MVQTTSSPEVSPESALQTESANAIASGETAATLSRALAICQATALVLSEEADHEPALISGSPPDSASFNA